MRVLHQGDIEVKKLMTPGVGVPHFHANCTGLDEVQSISTGAVHWNVNSKDLPQPSLDGDDVIEFVGSQNIPSFSTRRMELHVYNV